MFRYEILSHRRLVTATRVIASTVRLLSPPPPSAWIPPPETPNATGYEGERVVRAAGYGFWGMGPAYGSAIRAVD